MLNYRVSLMVISRLPPNKKLFGNFFSNILFHLQCKLRSHMTAADKEETVREFFFQKTFSCTV